MSFGSFKTVTVTVASGASTSSGAPLGGRPWSKFGVQVGTMSTACNVGIQNSLDGGSTYYTVFHQPIASATVGTPQMFLSSVIGANGGFVMLPDGTTLNYVRFLCTAVVSGGVRFTVVCSD